MRANILSGGMMVLNCMLFPICIYFDSKKIGICEICFLLTLIWIFTVNGLLVRLEKKLNPEKRGSVFEFDFQKKWHDSSDEAQKIIMYRAGYRAYRVTNMLCMIMWLSSIITYAVTAMKSDR